MYIEMLLLLILKDLHSSQPNLWVKISNYYPDICMLLQK